MKAIIIEDEHAAAMSLESLIAEVAPDIDIITTLQSIEESVEWFGTHASPGLVFMDIHLADGSSFAIFDRTKITCPVIFTTAYDRYALKAFEVNSVDYLLKPVSREHLRRAIDKFRNYHHTETAGDYSALIESIAASLRRSPSLYKSSLLVAVKDKLIPLAVKDVAYIYTENKIVRAVCCNSQSYAIDQTMDELSAQLDPANFFRANRQYIIAREAVKDMSMWFNGRLAVNLTIKTPEKIFVSRANVKEFKRWMTGE